MIFADLSSFLRLSKMFYTTKVSHASCLYFYIIVYQLSWDIFVVKAKKKHTEYLNDWWSALGFPELEMKEASSETVFCSDPELPKIQLKILSYDQNQQELKSAEKRLIEI